MIEADHPRPGSDAAANIRLGWTALSEPASLRAGGSTGAPRARPESADWRHGRACGRDSLSGSGKDQGRAIHMPVSSSTLWLQCCGRSDAKRCPLEEHWDGVKGACSRAAPTERWRCRIGSGMKENLGRAPVRQGSARPSAAVGHRLMPAAGTVHVARHVAAALVVRRALPRRRDTFTLVAFRDLPAGSDSVPSGAA